MMKNLFYWSPRVDLRFPHMYENADFSPETIRNSIKEGEMKTIQASKRRQLLVEIVYYSYFVWSVLHIIRIQRAFIEDFCYVYI